MACPDQVCFDYEFSWMYGFFYSYKIRKQNCTSNPLWSRGMTSSFVRQRWQPWRTHADVVLVNILWRLEIKAMKPNTLLRRWNVKIRKSTYKIIIIVCVILLYIDTWIWVLTCTTESVHCVEILFVWNEWTINQAWRYIISNKSDLNQKLSKIFTNWT